MPSVYLELTWCHHELVQMCALSRTYVPGDIDAWMLVHHAVHAAVGLIFVYTINDPTLTDVVGSETTLKGDISYGW